MKTLLVVIACLVAGCFSSASPPRMMTTQELEARSVKSYPTDVATGMRAAEAALRTLGFEVTVVSAETGIVKTAPRDFMSSASGARNQATVYRDELAWTVTLTAAGDKLPVKASPKAYTNGNPVPPDRIPAEALDPKFTAFWNELDAAMITARTPPAEAAR